MSAVIWAMVYSGEYVLPHELVSERLREGLDSDDQGKK